MKMSSYTRWQILFFAVVVACFLGAIAYSQIETRKIDALSQSIARNALPSIEHLSAARGELRRVDALATRFGDASPAQQRELLPRIAESLDRAEAELNEAFVLPRFPHELALEERIQASLARLEGALDESSKCLSMGDFAHAKATATEVLAASSDALAAANDDVALNAKWGERQAERIGDVRRSTLHVTLALTGVSLGLAIPLAFIAVLLVRRNARILQENNSLLARRADELELFAARVAHDIRNPLSTVSLSLGSLERASTDDSKSSSAARRGQRALLRALEILDGLLAFARAGARPAVGARADVRPVIDGVLEELGPIASAANVSLCCEPFPPCAVVCDPGVLSAVIANLVSNAIKYMEGDVRDVTIRVTQRLDMVRVEVRDTGVGVPPALQRLIFEPFARGQQSTRREGIGLGLATVKRICEAHGGHVGLISSEGRGSRFWFALPKA